MCSSFVWLVGSVLTFFKLTTTNETTKNTLIFFANYIAKCFYNHFHGASSYHNSLTCCKTKTIHTYSLRRRDAIKSNLSATKISFLAEIDLINVSLLSSNLYIYHKIAPEENDVPNHRNRRVCRKRAMK